MLDTLQLLQAEGIGTALVVIRCHTKIYMVVPAPIILLVGAPGS